MKCTAEQNNAETNQQVAQQIIEHQQAPGYADARIYIFATWAQTSCAMMFSVVVWSGLCLQELLLVPAAAIECMQCFTAHQLHTIRSTRGVHTQQIVRHRPSALTPPTCQARRCQAQGPPAHCTAPHCRQPQPLQHQAAASTAAAGQQHSHS
jgi:hypothetical protein